MLTSGEDEGNLIVSGLGTKQETSRTVITRELGPDHNGAATAPNYEGLTVNEVFSEMETNIEMPWIHPNVLAGFRAHFKRDPESADEVANAWVQAGMGIGTGTFTVSDEDTIRDSYSLT